MNPRITFLLIIGILLLLAVSAVRNIGRVRAAEEMATYTKQFALANEAFVQCVISSQDDITQCDERQRKVDEARRKLQETMEKHKRDLNLP